VKDRTPKRSGRYVVLDRDGTLNVEKGYVCDPADLELIPGVAEGLRLLQKHGFGLVVISNQSGIGRGIVTRDAVDAINARLGELLQRQGVELDGIYYCPHSPEQNCSCRKPNPTMIYQAAEDLNFNPRESFVVGDKCSDLEMGKRANAVTILVLTGYGRQQPTQERADFVAEDLRQAAAIIVKLSQRHKLSV
jgi:D-glycero-D-manno-heptose 1,7-bisphosphate phosphatase